MRSKYKQFGSGVYFITSTIVNWINLFEFPNITNILFNEINFRKKTGELKIFGFVIMPNHFHFIVYSDNLTSAMRNFKSFTAKEIIKCLVEENEQVLLKKFEAFKLDSKQKLQYQIWQEGYHPQLIINKNELEQKMNYIHYNPVRAGLVSTPSEWKYSSYHNYYGGDIIIELDSYI